VAPEQPVILATAHAENFPEERRPADAVLRKPFVFAELRRVIASVFNRK
jgi:CheY-like chemotaxis protein